MRTADVDKLMLAQWTDDGGAIGRAPRVRQRGDLNAQRAKRRARERAFMRGLRLSAGRTRIMKVGPDGNIMETWR